MTSCTRKQTRKLLLFRTQVHQIPHSSAAWDFPRGNFHQLRSRIKTLSSKHSFWCMLCPIMSKPNGQHTEMEGKPSGLSAATTVPPLSNFIYIYDIPRMEKKRLAALLEVNNKWYELGEKQMGYSTVELDVSMAALPVLELWPFSTVHTFPPPTRVHNDAVNGTIDRLQNNCWTSGPITTTPSPSCLLCCRAKSCTTVWS